MILEQKIRCGPNTLSMGSIFIRDDVSLPAWFRFDYEECYGWNHLVDADGVALERSAMENGWHFFYLASAIVSKRWNVTHPSAVRQALEDVMERVGRGGFNSFEISVIRTRKFLFWHSTRLTAYVRHLSPSPFLKSFGPYFYPHVSIEQATIFWHAADVEPQAKGL